MGRYAFFNTDLEFKFRFACQPSSDIRTFGGVPSYEVYGKEYGKEYIRICHNWTLQDKEYIEEQLKGCQEWLCEEPVDFSKYEKNLHGTYELKWSLDELYKEHSEELVARYILGCCIYHQLLYKEELNAHYET